MSLMKPVGPSLNRFRTRSFWWQCFTRTKSPISRSVGAYLRIGDAIPLYTICSVELEWNGEDHFWHYNKLFQSYIKYKSTASFKVAGTGNKNKGNVGTRPFVIHRLLLLMTMIFGLHKFQLRSGRKNMAKDVHKWQERFQDRGMSHYFDLTKESPKLRCIAKLMGEICLNETNPCRALIFAHGPLLRGF